MAELYFVFVNHVAERVYIENMEKIDIYLPFPPHCELLCRDFTIEDARVRANEFISTNGFKLEE